MNTLRLYIRYLGVSIRAQMEYRVSFIMQTLGHFLMTIIDFVAVWALFQRFDSILGWSFYEIAVFYGMISIAFAISDTLTRGFDIFSRLIRNGDFDRYLLRPRSTIVQLLGYEFTLRRVGRFSQGFIILLFGATHLQVTWTPGKITVMLWSLVGATCLFMGLIIIQATLTFWTTETLELMNTLTYGGIETAQFPLTIYLPWFRKFFTFVVPLACVNYFPILFILEKPDPLGTSAMFQCLAPAAGLLFLVVGVRFWNIGLRYYASTGS
jgi:ABC-2 type transport system permease protein